MRKSSIKLLDLAHLVKSKTDVDLGIHSIIPISKKPNQRAFYIFKNRLIDKIEPKSPNQNTNDKHGTNKVKDERTWFIKREILSSKIWIELLKCRIYK